MFSNSYQRQLRILSIGGKRDKMALSTFMLGLYVWITKNISRNMAKRNRSLLIDEIAKSLASLLIVGHIFGLKKNTENKQFRLRVTN